LKKDGSIVVVVLLLIIILFCYKYYQGKYKMIKKRWINETKKQRIIRGIFVLIAFFLPIILPFIIVKLR